MKYPYAVKKHGIYYSAGDEIPEAAAEKFSLPFSDDDIVLETAPEHKKLTRTEINRMSVANLREMALNTGVDGADCMTGIELKQYLISVFGL